MQDPNLLACAFEQLSDPATATLLGFPSPLSRLAFETGCYRLPRKYLVLLQDRASGRWAGLVVFWALPERKSWLEIMYCIHPDFRGRGYAVEGCRALLALLAQHRVCEGVTASVPATNKASQKVIKGLGMRLLPGSAPTTWGIRLEAFRTPLVDRLWPLVDWARAPEAIRRLGLKLYSALAQTGT